MANHIQILRRIGACENKQAQPDWKGPEIPACTDPAAFLCETCGHMLCGSHAGGHWHAVGDTQAIASRFQEQAAQAAKREASAQEQVTAMQKQLQAAKAENAKLQKIRSLLAQ